MSVTAYYSTHHDNPLIVLRSMRFMYFSDNINDGFHIATIYGKNIHRLLENARLNEGGDFRINFESNTLPYFEIRVAFTDIRMLCTAYSFLWKDFISGLKIIQRFIRLRVLKRKFSKRNDPFHLRKMKAFIHSDRGKNLPDEIIDTIIKARVPSAKTTKKQLRGVETKSFSENKKKSNR